MKVTAVSVLLQPNFEAVVEPLETCKLRTGGRPLYNPVVYGDHLTNKVLTNYTTPDEDAMALLGLL